VQNSRKKADSKSSTQKIYKVTVRYGQCTSLTNSVERLLSSVTDSLDFINKKP